MPSDRSSIAHQVQEFLSAKDLPVSQRKKLYARLNGEIDRGDLAEFFSDKITLSSDDSAISLICACADSPDGMVLCESLTEYLVRNLDYSMEVLSGWITRRTEALLRRERLSSYPTDLQWAWHRVARLWQFLIVLARKRDVEVQGGSAAVARECFGAVLRHYNESIERDIVTLAGFLYAVTGGDSAALFEGSFHVSSEGSAKGSSKVSCDSLVQVSQAVPRMAVARGRVQAADGRALVEDLHSLPDLVSFYAQFTVGASGYEVHYALQSVLLLLGRWHAALAENSTVLPVSVALSVSSLCLDHWDHPVQMVAAVSRHLLEKLCAIISPASSAQLVHAISGLQGELNSRKKFNALFTLASACNIAIVLGEEAFSQLVKELVLSVRVTCPAITAACQLLKLLIAKRPQVVFELVVDVLFTVAEDSCPLAMDQLMATLVGGNILTPKVDLISRIMGKTPSASHSLLLLQIAANMSDCLTFTADGTVLVGDDLILFSSAEYTSLILSPNCAVATNAVSVLLRCGGKLPVEWSSAARAAVSPGTLLTIGSSRNELAVTVNEFDKYFARNFGKSSDIQKSVFDSLLKGVFGIAPSASQEELLIGLEVFAKMSIDRFRQLCDSVGVDENWLFRQLLSTLSCSRWRKVRALCRDLYLGKFSHWVLPKDTADINPELAECVAVCVSKGGESDIQTLREKLLSCPIDNPDQEALSLLGVLPYVDLAPSVVLSIVSHVLAIAIHYSQFIGENCIEYILSHDLVQSSGVLASHAFSPQTQKISVDCRGHPIGSAMAAHEAWTNSRLAIAVLENFVNRGIFNPTEETIAKALLVIVSALLLSTKHPAEIVPLQRAFLAICRTQSKSDLVTRELWDPLISMLTDGESAQKILSQKNWTQKIFSLPAALRRSQGLGPLVCAMCVLGNVVSVSRMATAFLDSLAAATEDAECTLHCINILRAVVKNAEIEDRFVDPWLGRCVVVSLSVLSRLGATHWRIRSAATQLFVQSARRLVGTDSEDPELKSMSKKSVSAADLFFKRGCPELLDSVVSSLRNANDEHMTVALLALIQPLIMLEELRADELGSVLINQIREMVTTSPSCHVRKLAARIIASMARAGVGHAELATYFLNDNSKNESPHLSLNAIHGLLCYLHCLKQQGACIGFASAFIETLQRTIVRRDLRPALSIVVFKLIDLGGLEPGKLSETSAHTLLSYIASQPLDRCDTEEGFASLVVRVCLARNYHLLSPKELSNHPLYREYVARALVAFPGLFADYADELYLKWASYTYGKLALLHIRPGSSAAWLNCLSYDCLFEDEKLLIARIPLDRLRSECPLLLPRLLSDESADVRQAIGASQQENCVEVFQRLLRGDVELAKEWKDVEKFSEFAFANRSLQD